jgi:hypothetical protein
MSAEDNDVLQQRQAVGQSLIELGSIRGHVQDSLILPLSLQFSNAGGNRLDHHHHSGSSAKGVVVNLAVLVDGVIAELVQVNGGNAFLLGPLQDGMAERTFQQLGLAGQNINAHLM